MANRFINVNIEKIIQPIVLKTTRYLLNNESVNTRQLRLRNVVGKFEFKSAINRSIMPIVNSTSANINERFLKS